MTLKYLMDENVDPVYAKQLRRRESNPGFLTSEKKALGLAKLTMY